MGQLEPYGAVSGYLVRKASRGGMEGGDSGGILWLVEYSAMFADTSCKVTRHSLSFLFTLNYPDDLLLSLRA